jgi:hypothetical protein
MSDIAGEKPRGPVRTLRTENAEWDASHGVWQAPRGVTIVTFRRDGQFSEEEFHNPDGSVARWARVCRYDTLGCKTKVRFLAYQRRDPGIAYDVEGTEDHYPAPGAVTSTTAYDERERPTEVSFHDAKHMRVLRIVLSRDRDGRLLTEVAYMAAETLFADFPIDRVPPAERAQFETLMANVFADQAFSSTSYAYDQKGRLLDRTRRMGALSEDRTKFRYDDHDNPIEENSEHRAREMGIDDDGAVQTKEEEPRIHHVRFEYRYDGHGNWTERVVSSRTGAQTDFHRTNVVRRTITYDDV